MPRFRVIAHAMHEDEIRFAMSVISDPEPTEAFVVGVADEAQIGTLRENGLIVQAVSEVDARGRSAEARFETPGSGAMPVPGTLRSTTFSTSTLAVAGDIDPDRDNVFLIQIEGPLLDSYRRRLSDIGVQLLEGFGGGAYSAFLQPWQVHEVQALSFVARVVLYDARLTAPGAAAGLAPLGSPVVQAAAKRMVTYDIRLHRPDDLPAVLAWLRQRNVAVGGSSARKIRIYVLEGSPVLGALAALPEVQSFEEFVEPRLWNDRARALTGVDTATGAAGLPFDGDGEIVAVADTGLDERHPDFQGRVVAVIARGRPGQGDDPDGHGTHVAGSVLGDGASSAGVFKGTAPRARLFFQSLLDGQGKLGGLPLDLGDLFEEAYLAGARIHNDSWGAATASTYTMNSGEVDEFVAKRRDMLVVLAAGNTGQAANRINVPAGVVDWLSLAAPATAKNGLTVGASRSDRTSGGLSRSTWAQAWAQDFPDPWIATQPISGDPECLAAFSSRGPSDDRRVKPDLVAPGTDIVSCRSRLAPQSAFWGPYPNNPDYAYSGGTSMAAPLVAGCAALVRQFYRRERQHQASAALVRATLVNGARWLSGRDANESNPPGTVPLANYDQGFGCVDMQNTLPNPGNPDLDLLFVDNWASPAEQLGATGAVRRWTLRVEDARAFRVCLCYTDLPMRGLQNNLNLTVQVPGGGKLVGNHQLRQSLGIPDVDNNVEVIRMQDPAPGTYLVQVAATNLLRPPQDFALVATGKLTGALNPV